MTLVNLSPETKDGVPTSGVTLAVFAPFGSDEVLSTFPDGDSHDLAEHPLFKNLLKVAETGVNVSALVDLSDDETYLVDVPAGNPSGLQVVSRWKLDMTSPRTLAEFIRHAHQRAPKAALVLAMEGHGAGYVPDLDPRKLTSEEVTGSGAYEWHIGFGLSNVFKQDGSGTPKPALESGAPILPVRFPTCPTNHLILSTYGLGAALKAANDAGVPKLAVIHFNNCFNMAVEVLHTVAPYADWATGYPNYNFFTAADAYPEVFRALKNAGTATREQLAQWFAEFNRKKLDRPQKDHPTVGCVVRLSRLPAIADAIDELSDALLAVLRNSPDRPTVVQKIKQAIFDAQQYDADNNMNLDPPDALTDIDSLAARLSALDFGAFEVKQKASQLAELMRGIRRYGESGHPWTDPSKNWVFAEKTLAMSIYLPDPLLQGVWDWRAPYYLEVNPDPSRPLVQRNVIDFVQITDWADFIVEYHRETPFKGLLAPSIPEFRPFNTGKTLPPRSPGGKGNDKPSPQQSADDTKGRGRRAL